MSGSSASRDAELPRIDDAATQRVTGGRGVEPRNGVGVVVVAGLERREQLGEVARCVSVSTTKYDVSTCLRWMVASRTMPVRPIPPTVAQNSSAFSPSGVADTTSPDASRMSSWRDVVAEAAVDVVVLAVHVGRDRTADRDLAGAGNDRQPETEGEQRPQQPVEADARLHAYARASGCRRRGSRPSRSGRAPCRRRSAPDRRSCGPGRGR